MKRDVLGDCRWECAPTDPNTAADPTALTQASPVWIAASVPGTAAAALREQGAWNPGVADTDLLDGKDWWFRCRFSDPGNGPWLLHLRGLATLADVWLNGTHLLRSENMFVEHEREIDRLEPENELCIRFSALNPVLALRRSRPRWKSRLIRHQNLRWIRTTLLGRMDGWAAWAAPVGPWRPVELVPRDSVRITSSTVDARCDGTGGVVSVRATLATSRRPTSARVRVGEVTRPLEVTDDGLQITVEGIVKLEEVERWWPHTHGPQPRYPVAIEVDDTTIALTEVGFRTVEIDRRDDGFTFIVNDTSIFCRGAIWVPPDVISLSSTPEQLRESLQLMRDTGMNMVRLGGCGTYESPAFWDLCDELGVMVWQDCMLAAFDPPEDDEFAAALERELTQVLTRLQGRPALMLVCGSSETYQQAAMCGLAPGAWVSETLEKTIPAVVERTVPGVPYIASSPIGGQLPFDPSAGVAHYFGVGAYGRPLTDARLADVRFAAECLAFSIPPEPASIDEMFEGSAATGHGATWKAGVTRDAGSSWDFEDVRDFYVHHLFGCDPAEIRHADPDWALDLGRAAVAEAMSEVMAEWRRPGSRCSGGLVLSWRDLWPGAGWGLVDSLGRPKAPLYALQRVLDPVAVLVTDEGLSGLHVHVVNDYARVLSGRLELAAYTEDGLRIEHGHTAIEVGAHGHVTVSATELLGGFRDLTRAYKFGPPEHDVVCATLIPTGGGTTREAFYLPLGRNRPRRSDLGLTAHTRRIGPDEWEVTIESRLFAQYVAVDGAGCTPSDSWFHIPPGGRRRLRLRAGESERAPRCEIRALNSRSSVLAVENAG